VTIFSPWDFNIDAAARALLEPTAAGASTTSIAIQGRELVERYLTPLAAHPGSRRICAFAPGRRGDAPSHGSVPSRGREERPVRDRDGR